MSSATAWKYSGDVSLAHELDLEMINRERLETTVALMELKCSIPRIKISLRP
jgi:hypothetical protein